MWLRTIPVLPPLPAKPVIFLITAAILILLVVAFNPFRGRMAHAVCFAVIIISGIAVPGISICIRGQDVTDIIVFRLRRHAVYIDLSAGPIRFAFLIPLLIYLGKSNLPHVEYSSSSADSSQHNISPNRCYRCSQMFQNGGITPNYRCRHDRICSN